jgi:hypothetical protein
MLARALLVAVICLFSVAPAAAKEYYASRFDSRIEVLRGGALRVTETLVFHFTEGTFREVFRTIPTRRTDGIAFLSASMDGQMLPQGEGPGTVRIRRQDGLRVEWRFGPVGPSTHTFELTYLARGVVYESEGVDLLEWRALPRQHDYRIASSTVEILVPQQPVRAPALETRRIDGDSGVSVREGALVARADEIRRNGSFVVSAALPAHSVLDGPPAWQARRASQLERMPMWATSAGLVMVGGFILLFALSRSYEGPPGEHRVEWASMIPPESLSPAVAGALVSNGQPQLEHAMATLFALAERGILVIREEPKGMFGQRHFTLEQVRRAGPIAPHEEAALSVAFGSKESTTVALSKARSNFTRPSRWREFKSAVMRELDEAGLLDARRQASRRRFGKAGIGLMLLAVVAAAPCLLLVDEHGGWPFLVPLAIMMVAIVSFIIMSSQTPLSNNGVRRAEQWRAFKKHIADPQEIEPRWGAAGSAEARILPIAIALGLAAAWSKYLKKRNAQTPAWFHAASGLESGHAFATFVATSGAGAHGGGAGAGAGGAAGGGASGAS